VGQAFKKIVMIYQIIYKANKILSEI